MADDIFAELRSVGHQLRAMRRLAQRAEPSPERDKMVRDIEDVLRAWAAFLQRLADAVHFAPTRPTPRGELRQMIKAEMKPVMMAITQAEIYLGTMRR